MQLEIWVNGYQNAFAVVFSNGVPRLTCKLKKNDSGTVVLRLVLTAPDPK